MKKVQLLILGTTVLGVSMALKHDDVLVVDDSMLIAPEFIHSYKPCVDMNLKDDVPELYHPMKKMNLITDDGRVHLIPVSGILSEMLKKNGTDVKFFSTVLDVKRNEDKYTVKILNKNGIETVVADRIVDTTSEGIMHNLFSECKVSKYVCGMLVGPGGNSDDNYSFVRGRFDGETILKLNLNSDCSFDDARIMMGDLWHRIYKSLPDTRFATCAQRFDYEFDGAVKVEIDENWIWNPSVSYGDIFTAFKEGMK